MGELPPSCSTPQGPGVPWALRPRFPRVDSSRTTRVPSSRSVISHFAHLLSLRGSPPSSRSPFSLLAILTIPLHGPIQLPPRISPPSFARVSLRFLPFPSPSLRPVLSSSLHLCPLRFSRRLPAHMAFRLFPVLLPDPGFHRRFFAARFLWPAGRAEAPPHRLQRSGKVHRASGSK